MLDQFRLTSCFTPLLATAILLTFGATAIESADGGSSPNLTDALIEGTFGVDLRYRFEGVDDDLFEDNGLASTLRTVLKYESNPWNGVAVFVEMENVTDVGLGTSHNDVGRGGRGNGVNDRPVVADPSGTSVNQGYLDFSFVPESSIKVGRQEINLGNVRHVGNVGWRQHHQSFDAATLTSQPIPIAKLTYAYVDKVNRVFGDSVDMTSHLLEADVTVGKTGTVSAYGIFLDYEDEAMHGLSTSTVGLRFEGGIPINSHFKGIWDLEYATQKDYGSNPNTIDADYIRLQIGTVVGSWTFEIANETLEGGSAAGRFTTPLATLHAWNGWADQFLATPVNGLEDTWLLASATFGRWDFTGVYHDFQANTGTEDYGSEIDVSAVYISPWKQKFGLKIASYDADQYSRDVTKAMLWTSWGFE